MLHQDYNGKRLGCALSMCIEIMGTPVCSLNFFKLILVLKCQFGCLVSDIRGIRT